MALVDIVRQHDGVWTLADFDPEKLVVERQPLRMAWAGGELLTMPPPSSGGVALIEILQVLAARDALTPETTLTQLGHNSPAYLHRLTEAAKHAFADRATYLGDADFVDVPIARLTSPRYAQQLAAKFDPLQTHPPAEYGRYTSRTTPVRVISPSSTRRAMRSPARRPLTRPSAASSSSRSSGSS